MASRRLSRAAALAVAVVVAVAVAIGAGAAVAASTDGLRGSPAAVRVARRVLTRARHVAALRWQQTGDQWECPAPGGPMVGPAVMAPARSCRRATVSFYENLRNGLIVRSQSTITARGMATETDLVTAAGEWMRSGHARCWDLEGAAILNIPAFSYAGERLSIAAQTPSVISLHGVAAGYRETDAIDAHTFAVRGVDARVAGPGGAAHLVASFAELTRPFALPQTPRHVCSDIVRFPPQRGG